MIKSETEVLWDAVRKHFDDTREWKDLNQMQQQVFMQGINSFLTVLHKMV